MPKIKLMLSFVATMTTLIVVATPAMAEFESTTGKSQGPIVKFPESTVFEFVEGGPAIECKSKNKEGVVVAEGGWQIQVKSTTQQGKFFYQAPTLKGPHEQLKIIKWGICVGPLLLPVVVSCNLQIESNGTNPVGTGSVYLPGCELNINSGACIIRVQPDGNKELQGITLFNNIGVEIGGSLKGIMSTTQEPSSSCKNFGIKGSQGIGKIKFKNPFETEGQKLV